MKKLNLLVVPVLFSSLLIGCGMKGPLYRVPQEPQPIEKQKTAPEKEASIEQKTEKAS
ncbi:LPS translocon maturation chaperone LptM [Psychromonas hadalis]|uniref:LPS translocon maturation chaperone LptM n=1 Tax=Psychromonas hadalis TaxID=211669 RepID=UPI0003B4A9FF|nr:lipoprotein [Psychromonas hadalis]